MAVLEIVRVGQPILRERAKPVTRITDTVRRLIGDMIETMRAAPGLGLAAPQVNESLRIFVYAVDENTDDALINPEIVSCAGEEVGIEGCLSIPKLEGEVSRARVVEVTGLNRRGKKVRIKAEDLLARVFQHEIDHLDGILFTDRADSRTLRWVTDEEEVQERESPRRRWRRAPARSASAAR
jgi:peptide deformylase